ncbi:MAG: TolC family protein [Planctomycetes bacterium]|nr:TolC family protein [Planctomycetota bacterium]
MKRRIALICAAAAVIGGCGGSPYDDGDPVRMDGEETRGRSAVITIDTLTLAQALELAQREHPEIHAARAGTEAARGRLEQAGLLPNPALIARMESAPFDGRTGDEAEYVAGLSQRIPLGGDLSAERRVEEHALERSLARLESVRGEVFRRVQSSFALALYVQQVSEVQGRILALQESVARTARSRVEAGEIVADEASESELALVRGRLASEAVASMHRQAIQDLESHLGARWIRIESLAGDLDRTMQVPTIESLYADLSQHPGMLAAETDVEEALAGLDLARARRIPDLNLDVAFRRLEESHVEAFDVGFSITLPIFDRGQGSLREARARISESEARLRSTRRELQRQALAAYGRLERALSHARVVREEILPRREAAGAAAQARREAGEISDAEAAGARLAHEEARIEYLSVLREVMDGWADLSLFLQR